MIENIILDLGGVILDINYSLTSKAFCALGAKDFDEIYSQSRQNGLFDLYDIGKISSAEFREKLKKRLCIEHVNDADFDICWNAMLLNFQKEKICFLEKLKQKYNLFLFSNTNEIHIKEAVSIYERDVGCSYNHFTEIFIKTYYSHLCGFRKPAPESFKYILVENNLSPNGTMFIDDSVQHVHGARQAGLSAIHLTEASSIYDIYGFIEKINNEQ